MAPTPDTEAPGAVRRPSRERRLRVLHLGIRMAEVTAYTDNFCGIFATRHDTAVCSYFPKDGDFPPAVRAFPGDGTTRGFAASLRRAIASHRPDVIHSHYPHTTLLLLLWRRLLRRGDRTPVVQTVHNSYDNFSRRNRLLWRAVYSYPDRMVHCGGSACESFPQSLRATAKATPLAIPNGVDIDLLDRVAPPAGQGRRGDAPLAVGCVGRLIDCKNVELLVRAVAAKPHLPVHCTVIGDGELRESLVKLADREKVGHRFDFTGALPLHEVYRRVSRLDLVVHPSLGEGLPRSVLEAMALRRPVLLSDIGPHRDLNCENHLPLFDPRRADELARLLERHCELSGDELTARGERCRRTVERHFSLSKMHDRYTDVYQSVAGRSPEALSAAAA